MSYILDALKKIEHEKSKKVQPNGRVSISGDLFLDRMKPPAKVGIWKIVLLIAAASLVTCAGTWFMLSGHAKKSSARIRHVAPPPPAPVVAMPVLPPPAPVAVTPAAPPVAAPVTPKNREAVGNGDSSPREVSRVKKRIKDQPVSTSPKQPVQTVQAPADIKLTGIAWQDERSGRRAVINGFLLKEGAVISGAKITDIQSNRVRFTSAAGSFEIKLDFVLPAEVQK
jgi:general secretion pathway protein B